MQNLKVYMKSLEYSEVFVALLRDVQTLHSNVFTTSDLKRTVNKVRERIRFEGAEGFLTKTLPRLGKAFDKALSDEHALDAESLAFKSRADSKLPMLFGELFQCVLSNQGSLLPTANAACVKSLRNLLFCFYKLEIPYDTKLEQNVLDKFVKTEEEVQLQSKLFGAIAEKISTSHVSGYSYCRYPNGGERLSEHQWNTVREARYLLAELFRDFSTTEIFPRHGPGAVSTKEKLWDKYQWTTICRRITDVYPLDAYFYANGMHLLDTLSDKLNDNESPARVVLVPKDSRGPRLISCEPLDFQWIQQGLSRAIVNHVETHQLTKESVRFTDQCPNQYGALVGSYKGSYATLDLNEASDRVSLGLVRLLFPEPLLTSLLACRSLSTRLPDDKELFLHKFAPMGSALCFPVLALTIWSLLKAAFTDTDGPSNETIYVYGDDVIVRTAKAEHAMSTLQSFGLKINRDKSCTKGLFRESCGMDAFNGTCVTPVRFRTPWSSRPCPESYASWIAYANSLHKRKHYYAYNYIVSCLLDLYGPIPTVNEVGDTAPSLVMMPELINPLPRRWNKSLQKLEFRVNVVVPVTVTKELNGWNMLLRWFAEACSSYESTRHSSADETSAGPSIETAPFSVRVYTKRGQNKICKRWR
jgi:hypothetical protein